jgi:ABC-type lipopolysaccharide export system ATPase subunit
MKWTKKLNRRSIRVHDSRHHMTWPRVGHSHRDKGRVDLDGHNVTPLPMYQRRLGIGYFPQEASIFRGLNVEQNIRAVLEVVEKSAKHRERDLDELLEEFNITRLRKTPSIALSGGERRGVEIARALATRPNYMLLDEPFAGIDPIAVGDIQTLVRHRTRDAGPHGSSLHHLFRRSAHGGPSGRYRQRS